MSSGENGEMPEFGKLLREVGRILRRMSKLLRASLLLLILGILGRAIADEYSASFDFFTLLLYVGLVLLCVWFVRLFLLPIVRKQQVVEQWGILIEGGQDRATEILEHSQERILATRAPNITMEHQDVAPGIIRGVLGDTRPFLVISNSTNANLKMYRMYVNARDYGNNLQVSWYVISQPGVRQTFLALSMFLPILNLIILPLYIFTWLPWIRKAGVSALDLFDLQDLIAYVSNAHHCVLDAVDRLLLDLSQDPSKIERKSRGFLGIS